MNRNPPTDPSIQTMDALAYSIYRELYKAGYDRYDVISFANEILDLVTSELRDASNSSG
ncbi:MAG: hypothetical protein AAGF92_13410 [Myxococcota bacterium]